MDPPGRPPGARAGQPQAPVAAAATPPAVRCRLPPAPRIGCARPLCAAVVAQRVGTGRAPVMARHFQVRTAAAPAADIGCPASACPFNPCAGHPKGTPTFSLPETSAAGSGCPPRRSQGTTAARAVSRFDGAAPGDRDDLFSVTSVLQRHISTGKAQAATHRSVLPWLCSKCAHPRTSPVVGGRRLPWPRGRRPAAADLPAPLLLPHTAAVRHGAGPPRAPGFGCAVASPAASTARGV